MGAGDAVRLHFLEEVPDQGEIVSILSEFKPLHINEEPASLRYFLELGSSCRPSIIICTPATIAKNQDDLLFQLLIDSGHQFLIVSDDMQRMPAPVVEHSGSFSYLQRPLSGKKVRPLVLRAMDRIHWRNRREGSGLRLLDDRGLADAFLNIFDEISDPVFLMDAEDLTILRHNDAARQVIGMGSGMRGESFLDFSHQPERSRAALLNHTPYTADRIIRRRDGRLMMSSENATFYPSRERELALVVIKDMTPESDLRSEMRRRQRLFQKELDSIATPILQISFDHSRILFVNKATVDKLGYSRQQMLDSQVEELFKTGGELSRLLSLRNSFVTECRLTDASGNRATMEVHSQYIEEGDDSRFIVTLHDVTERQRMMEAQEISLKRLSEAQRMARVGSWSYDFQNKVPLFPAETLRLHGLDGVKPLSSEEYVDLISWEDRQEIDSWIKDLMDGVKPYPVRYTVRDHDGTPRYFIMNAEPLLDTMGRIVGLTGTSQDITEIEHLQQKNTLYSQTFDMMDLEMLFLSEDGSIVECNRSFARARGIPKEALKGRFVSILNPRYTRESWQQFWSRMATRGGETREEVHIRGDGSEYDVLISVSLLDYLEEKMVLAIITDVTELKAYQKELQSSLAEKTELLQEVHHRMGNNLQTISSFVSLKSMASPSEEIASYLDEVNDRIMGIAAIHNSMYEQQRFLDLDLLQHLRTVWEGSVKVTDMGHEVEIGGDQVFIDINRALPLSLVVSELLHNSMRHAFNGGRGRMELRLEDRDGSLLLHYSDDGKGYPCEDDRVSCDKLGMSLVRTLVERQLKGSIRFYNRDGANAEIVLPKGFFNRSIRDPLHAGEGL